MLTVTLVMLSSIAILIMWGILASRKDIPFEVFVVGAIVILVSSAAGMYLTAPDPVYTGEIIKFYANGTGLLDNGTLINLSDVPRWGCGP